MTDVLEVLRDANPVPECPPPPIDALWARFELDRAIPGVAERRRRGRTRAAAGLLVAISGAVVGAVVVVALTSLHAGKPAVGTPVGPGDVAGGNLVGQVIPSSVKLVVRNTDPAGGPMWGLRALTTTSGQLCMQLGRVQSGRLGVIGRDGVFADDGRFHPYAAGVYANAQCGRPGEAGHNFALVASQTVPASAAVGFTTGGCEIGGQSTCPRGDRLQLYYGLVGDAVAISYEFPTRRGVTGSTISPFPGLGPGGGGVPADRGAYLMVWGLDARKCVILSGGTGWQCVGGYTLPRSVVPPNARPTIIYSGNNHICYLPAGINGLAQGRCPGFGYGSPPYRAAPVTEARVRSKVTVLVHRRPDKHGEFPIEISFIARISAADGSYAADVSSPHDSCGGAGVADTPGRVTVNAGQHVGLQLSLQPCSATYAGTVTYQPTGRPPVLVDRFSVHVP